MIVEGRNGHINVAAYRKQDEMHNLVIELKTYEGKHYDFLTTNIDEARLPEDEGYICVNHRPWAPGFIEKYGLGKPTDKYLVFGCCVYLLYKFDLMKLGEEL